MSYYSMSLRWNRLLVLCVFALTFADLTRAGSPRAGSPRNVSYDHRALKIDGKRRLLVSGSIHYPRSTPAMWPSLLRQAREGGLDAITTYVFWNHHEEKRGVYDFSSGNRNLTAFLDAAAEAGLYVFVRLGPFVCAEWNYGGLPVWLRTLQSNYSSHGRVTFRTFDPVWINEMARFVSHVVQLLQGRFYGQGGNIILTQIENEYGNVEDQYGADGKLYAQWAADFANGLQTGVPVVMCQQEGVKGVLQACNGFYCDARGTPGPPLWTEAWSGWGLASFSESPSKRPVTELAFAIAKWVADGGSLFNYYMYHGGTNFGRTAAALMKTSYDFDAPINEFGLPNEPKYTALKTLHSVIHRYEGALLASDALPPQVDLGDGVTAWDYGGVAFIANSNTSIEKVVKWTCNGTDDSAMLVLSVPPWSVSIVDGRWCELVFNTATVGIPADVQPSSQSAISPHEVTDIKWMAEPRVQEWADPKTLSAIPEQIDFTEGKTDYLSHCTFVTVGDGDLVEGGVKLLIETHPGNVDGIAVFVDGVQKFQQDWHQVGVQIPGLQAGTSYELCLRTMTSGLANYVWSNPDYVGPMGHWDAHLENYRCGLLGNITFGRQVLDSSSAIPRQWSVAAGLLGELNRIWEPEASARAPWQTSVRQKEPNTWYSIKLRCSAPADAPVALDLGSMRQGSAWVNGHHLGRFRIENTPVWEACRACSSVGIYDPNKECHFDCGKPGQRYYHVPPEWHHSEGSFELDEVVLWEEVGGDPSGVTCVSMSLTQPAEAVPLVV
eukprot:TRINITY_DN56077_c0_g1_i1.p1 TRINITY_DN56077_c0_g1~~TRINITY_DN56077_c0_g1_i1.p1  ORF type:complete len:798 (+),score=105.28 TRINITY_DN56077_c0_g1_i1:64-2394(+)